MVFRCASKTNDDYTIADIESRIGRSVSAGRRACTENINLRPFSTDYSDKLFLSVLARYFPITTVFNVVCSVSLSSLQIL